MERQQNAFFSPRQYQYLFCIHQFPDGMRTMRNLIGEMGVPRSTAYYNVGLLTDKGLLIRNGNAYDLTGRGREIVEMDRDTFDNLLFWLWDNLGDGELARRMASSLLCRQPIAEMRRLANSGASGAALLRAGGPARGPLASLPPGRHNAAFSVRRRDAGKRGKAEADGRARAPAVFVVGRNGDCALELYAAHVRRIAAVAMPGGNRAIPKRLLCGLGGGMTECPEFAKRWHIRGNAVTGSVAADGTLTGQVRVAVENARGERFPAEIVLRFCLGADGDGDRARRTDAP
jgi:DNA-binding MarR family transcriptional regulator